MFYHSSIGATANLLLSAQRNAFSLTSSTCKKLNNDERSVTNVFYWLLMNRINGMKIVPKLNMETDAELVVVCFSVVVSSGSRLLAIQSL